MFFRPPAPCCKSRSGPSRPFQPTVTSVLHNVRWRAALFPRLASANQPVRRQVTAYSGDLGMAPHQAPSTAVPEPEGAPPPPAAFEAAVQAAPSGAPGSGSPAAGADQGSTTAANIAACMERDGSITWRPEDIKVLLAHIASLPPGRGLKPRQAMEKLGLSIRHGSNDKIYFAVKAKLTALRIQLSHGHDPLGGGVQVPRARRRTYDYPALVARAFKKLPACTGTLDDVAAVMEADPEISPKLNKTPHLNYRDLPMWRTSVSTMMSTYPEYINTGEKRGRFVVYRYDEEAARARQERTMQQRAAAGRKMGKANLGKRSN